MDHTLPNNTSSSLALSTSTLAPSCPWFPSSLVPPQLCSVHGASEEDPVAPPPPPRPLGGWRTMPYILLNELAERLASVGLTLNFISYLMGKYHLNQVAAASLINIVAGTASLTPLIGAFLSDAYLGRFWTITLGSFSNLIASALLISTAAFSSLRPPPELQPSRGQFAFLILALTFTVLASGGLRPCTYAFGADQFQTGSLEDKKQTQSFFNWYFFFLYTAALAGATVLVYVQDNKGWVWGFSVPGVSVVIAIIMLFLGTPGYRYVPPSGSPFTGFGQVLVAAFRKRHHLLPSDASKLHQGSGLKEISKIDLLPHTNRLRWLDHAAIETDDDFNETGRVKNRFRLCTVHQIEQLKAVIALTPIWVINVLSTTVLSQHTAFNIPQAKTMNRHITRSFKIPSASMSVFASVTLLLWMPIYDKIVVPKARKITGHSGGIKVLQRIGIGFFISVVALLVSGIVESRRRQFAHQHGFTDQIHKPLPISVFWLVPQYCLFGLGDSFHAVGQLEFLYDQLPDNMRSMAGAVFWCSAGLGHYAGTVIIQMVHKFTATSQHPDWLADNLNRGHLDYFYYLLACLQVCNFIAFMSVARHYTYKGEFHKDQQHVGDSKRAKLEEGGEDYNQMRQSEAQLVSVNRLLTASDANQTPNV